MKRRRDCLDQKITSQHERSRTFIQTETSCAQNDETHRETHRDIEEFPDGSRTIKETETSKITSQSQSIQKAISIREEIKHTLNILSTGKPSEWVAASVIGRSRVETIQHNLERFNVHFPQFVLQGCQKTDAIAWKKAFLHYSGAPFVNFSWKEIFNTKINLTEAECETILLNKLVWKAVNESQSGESQSLLKTELPEVDDSDVRIRLISFNTDTSTARIHLICEDKSLQIELEQVDPFILKLIPDGRGQNLVQNVTNCLAQSALSELATL